MKPTGYPPDNGWKCISAPSVPGGCQRKSLSWQTKNWTTPEHCHRGKVRKGYGESSSRHKSLLLGSQLIQPVVHLHDGLHGETKSALCTLQHPADTVELVLVDNVPEEQVGRELDGNLPNIPGGTFMLLPYMLQLLTGYQHQVIITDNLAESPTTRRTPEACSVKFSSYSA